MLISKDLHVDILVIYFSKWLIDCMLIVKCLFQEALDHHYCMLKGCKV